MSSKVIKILSIAAVLVSSVILSSFVLSSSTSQTSALSPQYYSPLQNAEYVSRGTTIAVRYGPELSAENLADLHFSVQGEKSGSHSGQTLLADDRKTVIFKPTDPFTPGEQVTVDLNGLQLEGQSNFRPLSYTFTISVNQHSGSPGNDSTEPATKMLRSAFPHFLTLPGDIPHYTVSTPSQESDEGYIFVAPFYWTKSTLGSYLLILNGQGQIVYYQSVADDQVGFDFKVQPNGLLSYYSQKDETIYLMDSHYQVVDQYRAGNGYAADLHDFQILPNGDALLMAYDAVTVDMSQVVKGGKKDATVIGLVIQELDPSRNVIFEWRSWDHVAFSDSTTKLTGKEVDLVHGNALALSNDGNLLLSSRDLSEITKIDRQTGEVIWRLGGKANMFKFVDSQPFAYQHDVRQLPNGNLTVFDNHGTPSNPAPSRGVQYALDEENKTVRQVWEVSHEPPVFATFMGNLQRLPDGNSLLSWGAPSTKPQFGNVAITEVSPDKQVLFELAFDRPYVSYRAFRFPWHGFPDTLPALALKVERGDLTLGYSWNGATEVAGYRIYAGGSPGALDLLEERVKADFETQSHFRNLPGGECYFQVAAMDNAGNELARSEVVSTNKVSCPVSP